jgi:hypothetical protein
MQQTVMNNVAAVNGSTEVSDNTAVTTFIKNITVSRNTGYSNKPY